MKRNILKTASCIGLAGIATATLLSCSDKTGAYNNETDPLIISTQDVDQVFNPFFSSSLADSSVIAQTQMSMLGNDKTGNVTTAKTGDSVVVYDYDIQYNSSEDKSTYYLVLRNDVKYSNGSPLTIKDVLFNLYVYLDPVYNGSTTIYSTDIVGLKEYRTQEADEDAADAFNTQFEVAADTRIDNLSSVLEEILEEHDDESNDTLRNNMVNYLKDKEKEYNDESYQNLSKDYQKLISLFNEEIDKDYNNSRDGWVDLAFVDKDKIEHKDLIKNDVQMFLYAEGFITWNAEDAILETQSHSLAEYEKMSAAEAKSLVINANIPSKAVEVLNYWQSGSNLRDYIIADLKEEYMNTHERQFMNISGIKFANRTESVAVNGVTYGVPTYDANGVPSSYEVLSIEINGQDPKAIWNFAFSVAPMYYYSNQEQIALFDYESNFGVKYMSQDFRDNVLKDQNKISVPMGAGAYKAASSNGTDNVTAGTFFDGTTIYFTRNEYFKDVQTGKSATIKNMYYRVVPTNGILSALYTNEVDYADPSAKPETITELNAKAKDGIKYKQVKTSGYGYIGINASKVPSIYVRQAIMHAINSQDVANYYGANAEPIYRSMSTSNWAYPKGATAYYPFIGGQVPEDLTVVNPYYAEYVTEKGYTKGQTLSEADQLEFLNNLIEMGGYVKNANGVYSDLKYTFTVAGASEDHPAFSPMNHAATLLNKIGMQITVSKDSNALKKLNSGELTVWAAAWTSTIDPDMYQVYHKDTQASSRLNWGYNAILRDTSKYAIEYELLDELSTLIEDARHTTNQTLRKQYYKEALDLVMQMAIELPTYQRNDLYAYNANKLDESSLNLDTSAYSGLLNTLWRTSLVA